jgi:hypothetical protein
MGALLDVQVIPSGLVITVLFTFGLLLDTATNKPSPKVTLCQYKSAVGVLDVHVIPSGLDIT